MMTIPTVNAQVPVYRELNQFLSVIGSKKKGNEPFLKTALNPQRLVKHLEKELPVAPEPAIFRRLGRHTQLVLQFI